MSTPCDIMQKSNEEFQNSTLFVIRHSERIDEIDKTWYYKIYINY
jgi:hypothetical protein